MHGKGTIAIKAVVYREVNYRCSKSINLFCCILQKQDDRISTESKKKKKKSTAHLS